MTEFHVGQGILDNPRFVGPTRGVVVEVRQDDVTIDYEAYDRFQQRRPDRLIVMARYWDRIQPEGSGLDRDTR